MGNKQVPVHIVVHTMHIVVHTMHIVHIVKTTLISDFKLVLLKIIFSSHKIMNIAFACKSEQKLFAYALLRESRSTHVRTTYDYDDHMMTLSRSKVLLLP